MACASSAPCPTTDLTWATAAGAAARSFGRGYELQQLARVAEHFPHVRAFRTQRFGGKPVHQRLLDHGGVRGDVAHRVHADSRGAIEGSFQLFSELRVFLLSGGEGANQFADVINGHIGKEVDAGDIMHGQLLSEPALRRCGLDGHAVHQQL
jgi:hypothetical protein